MILAVECAACFHGHDLWIREIVHNHCTCTCILATSCFVQRPGAFSE